jgi:hypothetical protein
VLVSIVRDVIVDAAMIAAFVTVMMVGIEYLSVITRGAFQRELRRSRWSQYVGAAILGALPGCLGPFTIVALYSHRVVSFGALVATMIATSGDESWVMLALFPAEAVGLMGGLALLGVAAGALTDLVLSGRQRTVAPCTDLVIHSPESCRCFPGWDIVELWRHPRPVRVLVMLGMVVYTVAIATGLAGPPQWNWIRISLTLSGLFGVFVVSSVPDHFLSEHIWLHVVRRHVPRILGWTVAAMLLVALLDRAVHLQAFVYRNAWAVLGSAVAIGVIPESGPHLVFVRMFDEGAVPASILVASSIVQDGHGMLPLLAESRKEFLRVKLVNVIVGLIVGATLLAVGA